MSLFSVLWAKGGYCSQNEGVSIDRNEWQPVLTLTT